MASTCRWSAESTPCTHTLPLFEPEPENPEALIQKYHAVSKGKRTSKKFKSPATEFYSVNETIIVAIKYLYFYSYVAQLL